MGADVDWVTFRSQHHDKTRILVGAQKADETEEWKMKIELMSPHEVWRLKTYAAEGHPVRRLPELAAFLEVALKATEAGKVP